jgi:hypothetical protein
MHNIDNYWETPPQPIEPERIYSVKALKQTSDYIHIIGNSGYRLEEALRLGQLPAKKVSNVFKIKGKDALAWLEAQAKAPHKRVYARHLPFLYDEGNR